MLIASSRLPVVLLPEGVVKMGFGRFRLRGSDKAGDEWTLVCLVHNIRKIYARIIAKGDETDGLIREVQAAYNAA
jgi:hypothetical protein